MLVFQNECLNKHLYPNHYWELRGSYSYTQMQGDTGILLCLVELASLGFVLNREKTHAAHQKFPAEVGTDWLIKEHLVYMRANTS